MDTWPALFGVGGGIDALSDAKTLRADFGLPGVVCVIAADAHAPVQLGGFHSSLANC